MARQLAFDWPRREALGEEDFFVSDANAVAHAMVMAPHAWPEGRLALVGPEGSGKTHLARLYAQSTGAPILAAAGIDPGAPLPERHLVVEDADRLPRTAEEWLFHAHNHLVGPGRDGSLLLTGRTAPARWAVALPDLASRLAAAQVVRIEEPDDVLLSAVLMKQFQDRQLAPSPAAMELILRHGTRSFAAVRRITAAIDAEALARGAEIRRGLVREVLDKLAAEDQ